MNRMRIVFFISVMVIGVLSLTILAEAQKTLSITFTKKLPPERAGQADYTVKWTDVNASFNSGYHYIINTDASFQITKRNTGGDVKYVTTRECTERGLAASRKYYIHIAPENIRGAISSTESFPLF